MRTIYGALCLVLTNMQTDYEHFQQEIQDRESTHYGRPIDELVSKPVLGG